MTEITDEEISYNAEMTCQKLYHCGIINKKDFIGGFYEGFKACQSMSPRWVKWSDKIPQPSFRLISRFIHTNIPIHDPFEVIKQNPGSEGLIEYLYEPPKTDNDGRQ